MTRPAFDDFKTRPFLTRWNINGTGRNSAVTWLLVSAISIPLLLVTGFFRTLSGYCRDKVQKNAWFIVPYVFTRLLSMFFSIVTDLTRIILWPVLILPGILINWGVSLIQALRREFTLEPSLCHNIAGSMDDPEKKKSEWRSLVNICQHPIQCWKNRKESIRLAYINRQTPDNLSAIRALLPAELIARKAAFDKLYIKSFEEYPESDLTRTLAGHMNLLFTKSDYLRKAFFLTLELEDTFITDPLKGVSEDTVLAALKDDQHPTPVLPSLDATDSFLRCFSSNLRLLASPQNNASEGLSEEDLFFEALKQTLKEAKYIATREIAPTTVRRIFTLAVCAGNIEVVKLLRNQKEEIRFETPLMATVNSDKVSNFTFLHYAAHYGHPEIAQFLIENGAKIDAKDSEGKIPLAYVQDGEHAAALRALLTPPVEQPAPLIHSSARIDPVMMPSPRRSKAEVLNTSGRLTHST